MAKESPNKTTKRQPGFNRAAAQEAPWVRASDLLGAERREPTSQTSRAVQEIEQHHSEELLGAKQELRLSASMDLPGAPDSSDEAHRKAFAARYNACLGWLSRREHSAYEIERKLKERFPDDPEMIAPVLDQLQTLGLQDDQRFAEMLVRYRALKGQGPIKIRAELKAKGVPQAVMSEVMSISDHDWSEIASSVIAKKYGEWGDTPLSPKERARRQRFLQSRGFLYEHIAAAL